MFLVVIWVWLKSRSLCKAIPFFKLLGNIYSAYTKRALLVASYDLKHYTPLYRELIAGNYFISSCTYW